VGYFGMNGTKQKLDLNKVKDIIFKDLGKLLKDLDIEWDSKNNNVFMPCPIHGGDNPNGLSISSIHKNWRCWTHSCHEEFGTDIFGFIGGCRQDATFSDTLRYVCKLYNIGNEHTSTSVKPENNKSQLEEIVDIFKPEDTQIKEHAYTRDVKTIKNSPYFENNRGFLSSKSSSMFNRAIIPVRFQNKEVGYIARATKDYIQPKYLFSSGFKKTEYLYNYDEAVGAGLDKHTLFLVEGQGDVWKLYEAGVKNAVGLFGKDISNQQIKLLVGAGVTYIVVLTDNDQAGREGRMKIQRELSRMFNLIYPPMLKKDIGDMTLEQIKDYILPHVKGLY
jgi:5S rRNA maturation endonuclease (ribonuclease M5)